MIHHSVMYGSCAADRLDPDQSGDAPGHPIATVGVERALFGETAAIPAVNGMHIEPLQSLARQADQIALPAPSLIAYEGGRGERVMLAKLCAHFLAHLEVVRRDR